MRAEELRIGNLVFDEIGHLCSISTIAQSSIRIKYGSELFDIGLDDSLIHPEHLKPIPLTEEWLLKFGFEKHGEWFVKTNWPLDIHYLLDGGRVKIMTIGTNEEYPIDYQLCESVHQLQNVYFYLTGKELEMLS